MEVTDNMSNGGGGMFDDAYATFVNQLRTLSTFKPQQQPSPSHGEVNGFMPIDEMYRFSYPTTEMYRTKLLQILKPDTTWTPADMDALFQIAVENKVTMRPFITNAVRFLFDADPVKSMLESARKQFVVEYVEPSPMSAVAVTNGAAAANVKPTATTDANANAKTAA